MFQAAKTGAEDEAAKLSKEHGVTIKIDWRTPNEEDPQKQADAVEQLVKPGANGIAISCSDANKLTDAIDKAVDNGVPVVTFDSDAPKSKRLRHFRNRRYRLRQENDVRTGKSHGWQRNGEQSWWEQERSESAKAR